MVLFLPPCIDPACSLVPRLMIRLVIILIIEWCCLVLYAGGGEALPIFSQNDSKIKEVNRGGTLLLAIGAWLVAG